MQQPLNTCWKAIKKILRYLKCTIDFHFSFTRSDNLGLTGYLNVDWESDLDNRRSTTGFYVYLGNNIVSWSSKKQHTISRSNTKVGYKSLVVATSKI